MTARIFARQSWQHPYHLVLSESSRVVVTQCGLTVLALDIYHCCDEAGPDAKPVIGTTCGECVEAERAAKAMSGTVSA